MSLLHTQVSVPTLMASKFFPLLVLRSWNTKTASRLMSLSEGVGEPSTHPFHPFLCATRFFRFFFFLGRSVSSISSSSAGVRGLLEDVRDVETEIERPRRGLLEGLWDVEDELDVGVSDGRRAGKYPGGGVTETERSTGMSWILGRPWRAVQKVFFFLGSCWTGWGFEEEAMGSADWGTVRSIKVSRLGEASGRFLESFLFLALRISSFASTSLLGPTPLRRDVRTSRSGEGSK